MKLLPSLSLMLAALLPVAGASAASSTFSDRAAFIGLATSVLRIEAPRTGGGYSLGSGVAIGRDTVVTNCHVTRDAREVNVVRGGVRLPASAQASDVARDLCLLRVPGLVVPTVALGRAAELRVGQPVNALGYTGGFGLQHSAGEVMALHRHDGAQVIQSSNRFTSGASGGGLFDDAGRLVGILTFRLRGGEAHYFAAPAEWVRQLAEQGRWKPVAPLESLEQPFWELDPLAQPRFLRAAVLQRDERWSELCDMAADWSRAEPDDGEAWFVLGQALQMTGRTGEARRALTCALQFEPARAAAQRRLAEMAAANEDLPDNPCRLRPT